MLAIPAHDFVGRGVAVAVERVGVRVALVPRAAAAAAAAAPPRACTATRREQPARDGPDASTCAYSVTRQSGTRSSTTGSCTRSSKCSCAVGEGPAVPTPRTSAGGRAHNRCSEARRGRANRARAARGRPSPRCRSRPPGRTRNVGDAHFAIGDRGVGNLEADVVATLLERDDLGVVPLVSEPLPVGEAARVGPCEQSCHRLHDVVALVRAVHADVGHAARREVANGDREAVGILPAGRRASRCRRSGEVSDPASPLGPSAGSLRRRTCAERTP